jgi:hypothetical protein
MGDPSVPLPNEEPDPERVEHEIDVFIDRANRVDGPSIDSLSEQVTELLRSVWDEIARVTMTLPKNKVIATMLHVGRQAREVPADDPLHWYSHAASTLLNGLVGPTRPAE